MLLAASEGMVAVRLDGTIVSANHAAEALVGSLPVGQAIWDVEGLESMRFVLESWASTGGPPRVTLEVPDGLLVDVDVSGYPAGPPLQGFLLNVRENRYAWLTTHDARTGLLNREAFLDRMDHLDARPGGAVVLLDIDGLRLINYQFGNWVGDSVLVLVARAIASALTEGGVAARFDGDQFVVLLPEVSLTAAQDIVADVLDKVRHISEVRDVTVSVTASAGVAELTDGRFTDVLRADKALAAAKAQGRDRQVSYGPGVQDWAQDKKSLMTWLHETNAENELLREESRTDALTQLPNVRALDEGEQLLAGATYAVGVLFIDLDHFHEYNRRYGDAAGDCVLQDGGSSDGRVRPGGGPRLPQGG